MKYTLLEMTQKILESIDGDPVNSVTDTVEAIQISSIIEQTFFALCATKTIPEHRETIKLTAASDSNFPTHFRYPDRVSFMSNFWYDTSDDDTFEYSELTWLEPVDFLELTDSVRSNYVLVDTKVGGTKLRITNNKHPQYYTSFDDDWIVCNSYKSTVDATLQTSKSRALVIRTPTWSPHDDDFVPDIDDDMFTILLNESKVLAQSELHENVNPVVDRMSSRVRAGLQDKKRKNRKAMDWSTYGR